MRKLEKVFPLLFIHGFPFNHTLWNEQFGDLQKAARLIAPDLRGHGASQATPGAYTMELVADDINAFLDALRITDKVILCGLSLGGYMSFPFYRKYAHRLAGLILTATRASADTPEIKLNRENQIALTRTSGVKAEIDLVLPKFLAPEAYRNRPELVKLVRQIMESTSLEGVLGDLMGMRDRPDSRPLLKDMRLPVLIIHGTDDQLIPLSEAELMRDEIPGAQLIVIPDAGHLPNLEQPDLFNQAVRQFISQFQS